MGSGGAGGVSRRDSWAGRMRLASPMPSRRERYRTHLLGRPRPAAAFWYFAWLTGPGWRRRMLLRNIVLNNIGVLIAFAVLWVLPGSPSTGSIVWVLCGSWIGSMVVAVRAGELHRRRQVQALANRMGWHLWRHGNPIGAATPPDRDPWAPPTPSL